MSAPHPRLRDADLDGLELHPFRVPLRLRFRGVDERSGVLLHGPAGWGEFSPFPEYGDDYAARWLAAAVRGARDPLPPARRTSVPVNATVPAVAPDVAHRLVREAGCRTVKVKVAEAGQTLADDRERVAAVRDALGPGGRVRVDANGAWDVATAALAIATLGRSDLEYVEQPVATLEELRDLRGRVDVPLAVDESVRTAADPRRIAGLDAADVLVLKAQPLGGAAAVVEIAAALGRPVVVSSALETSVGLAAGVAAAAALPELPYACGLGTGRLLAGDVVAATLVPEDGAVVVARPHPDADLLERWRPPDADARALVERVHRAATAAGRFR